MRNLVQCKTCGAKYVEALHDGCPYCDGKSMLAGQSSHAIPDGGGDPGWSVARVLGIVLVVGFIGFLLLNFAGLLIVLSAAGWAK